jgi:hypothetical protein
MLRGDHEQRDGVVIDDDAARDALLLDGLDDIRRRREDIIVREIIS